MTINIIITYTESMILICFTLCKGYMMMCGEIYIHVFTVTEHVLKTPFHKRTNIKQSILIDRQAVG